VAADITAGYRCRTLIRLYAVIVHTVVELLQHAFPTHYFCFVEGEAGTMLCQLRAGGGRQPLSQRKVSYSCTTQATEGSSARVSHEQGIFVLAFRSRRVKCATVN
jgi:hypothetical protein